LQGSARIAAAAEKLKISMPAGGILREVSSLNDAAAGKIGLHLWQRRPEPGAHQN
jgi:hypothetical protein